MPRTISAAALLGAGALAACSPTLNWREVRAEPTALKAMLPCKPDKAEREVPLGGRPVVLHALGCQAGGATFALLYGELGSAGGAADALAQWKLASLANIRGSISDERAFQPPGALGLPQSLKVTATGQRPDGSAVRSEAAYFAQGTYVFQAVVFAKEIKPEAAEPFFSALRFE